MTAKQFYDWQTSGGAGDVMRLVECLEHADVAWCAIGGVAVNHWAAHPELWGVLPEGLRQQVQRATGRELTPELTSVDPVRPGLTQAEACGLHPAQHQHE